MLKLFVPLGLILISVVIGMLFLIPGWQHFLAVEADTRHLEDINTELDTLTSKRDALVEQINGISREDFERINQMIPTGAHGPEFLVYLEQLASAHGVATKKLDLGSSIVTKEKVPDTSTAAFTVPTIEEPLPYKMLTANMVVLGTYDALKDFLRALESSVRITDVTSVGLGSEKSVFSFDLVLQTYYQ